MNILPLISSNFLTSLCWEEGICFLPMMAGGWGDGMQIPSLNVRIESYKKIRGDWKSKRGWMPVNSSERDCSST